AIQGGYGPGHGVASRQRRAGATEPLADEAAAGPGDDLLEVSAKTPRQAVCRCSQPGGGFAALSGRGTDPGAAGRTLGTGHQVGETPADECGLPGREPAGCRRPGHRGILVYGQAAGRAGYRPG